MASNVELVDLERLSSLTVEIGGIPTGSVQLDGGRQTLNSNKLIIERETLENLSAELQERDLPSLEKIFLKPGPFIQADDPKIVALAAEIVGDRSTPSSLFRMTPSGLAEPVTS